MSRGRCHYRYFEPWKLADIQVYLDFWHQVFDLECIVEEEGYGIEYVGRPGGVMISVDKQ